MENKDHNDIYYLKYLKYKKKYNDLKTKRQQIMNYNNKQKGGFFESILNGIDEFNRNKYSTDSDGISFYNKLFDRNNTYITYNDKILFLDIIKSTVMDYPDRFPDGSLPLYHNGTRYIDDRLINHNKDANIINKEANKSVNMQLYNKVKESLYSTLFQFYKILSQNSHQIGNKLLNSLINNENQKIVLIDGSNLFRDPAFVSFLPFFFNKQKEYLDNPVNNGIVDIDNRRRLLNDCIKRISKLISLIYLNPTINIIDTTDLQFIVIPILEYLFKYSINHPTRQNILYFYIVFLANKVSFIHFSNPPTANTSINYKDISPNYRFVQGERNQPVLVAPQNNPVNNTQANILMEQFNVNNNEYIIYGAACHINEYIGATTTEKKCLKNDIEDLCLLFLKKYLLKKLQSHPNYTGLMNAPEQDRFYDKIKSQILLLSADNYRDYDLYNLKVIIPRYHFVFRFDTRQPYNLVKDEVVFRDDGGLFHFTINNIKNKNNVIFNIFQNDILPNYDVNSLINLNIKYHIYYKRIPEEIVERRNNLGILERYDSNKNFRLIKNIYILEHISTYLLDGNKNNFNIRILIFVRALYNNDLNIVYSNLLDSIIYSILNNYDINNTEYFELRINSIESNIDVETLRNYIIQNIPNNENTIIRGLLMNFVSVVKTYILQYEKLNTQLSEEGKKTFIDYIIDRYKNNNGSSDIYYLNQILHIHFNRQDDPNILININEKFKDFIKGLYSLIRDNLPINPDNNYQNIIRRFIKYFDNTEWVRFERYSNKMINIYCNTQTRTPDFKKAIHNYLRTSYN